MRSGRLRALGAFAASARAAVRAVVGIAAVGTALWPHAAAASPAPASAAASVAPAASTASAPAAGAASFAAERAPFVFPVYRSGAEVAARCDALLRELERRRARLAREPAAAGVLAQLDDLTLASDQTLGPIAFLSEVHPAKPVRDAAEACELRYERFSGRLLQDAAIHRRLQGVEPADALDARSRDEWLALFEDAGVALAPSARARARALKDQIGELSQTFERRVREDRTKVPFTEAELEGVPERVWRDAPRDAHGRRLLGLDYPTYDPLVEGARDPAARERMWRAYQSRGGRANLATLARIVERRRDYARLFGAPSYADFVLRRRMAQRVDAVQGFLGEVTTVVGRRETDDLAELRAAKAAERGLPPDDVRLERWDVPYYFERVKRERFALDQERFRRHFPPEASVDFVFALAGRLFGVGLRPLTQPLWHADARAWEVFDPDSGRTLATLYTDLYPRPDKYGHAAVWSVRGGATRAGRLPTAALVTNFDRRGLTLDELETLLHEFGHALHVVLSTTRYATLSGTNVKLDFVEAPSQMLEEWVYDPRVLALFAEVCPSCEPVPADLLERARQSRSFGKGLHYARQHLYARYDLALHGPDAPEPLVLWSRMEGATPLGTVPGTLFPAGFTHLVSGYGAGYYAYLWSLATARDLYSAFAADPLDAATGKRYRAEVLAPGGGADPATLVARFLGRPPSNAAFFEWLAH